ncbi:porin family protein [Amylibacter sp.]|nr:porin family protein [Amylibacter sp.]
MNDMISVEAETSLPVSKNNITDIVSEITGEFSVYHTAVFAKFTLPTSGSFKPFARAGMTKVAFKAEDESNYAVLDDTVFSYGIGAEWALSEKFGLRADYTISKFDPYDNSAADINILALSSVYRF